MYIYVCVCVCVCVCVFVRMYIHGHYFCPHIQDPLVSVMVFQVKETESYKGQTLFSYSSLYVQEKMLLHCGSLS